QATVWLVNTGWTGGGYGQGSRIKLAYTRALVQAALSGQLDRATFKPDPVFGVLVPTSCPRVPPEILQPGATWKKPADYDAKARQVASLCQDNFKQFAADTSEEVRQAGPKVKEPSHN